MSQPVVNKNATRKRENLSFILQPSEGGRKYNPVEIPLKVRTGLVNLGRVLLCSESLS